MFVIQRGSQVNVASASGASGATSSGRSSEVFVEVVLCEQELHPNLIHSKALGQSASISPTLGTGQEMGKMEKFQILLYGINEYRNKKISILVSIRIIPVNTQT